MPMSEAPPEPLVSAARTGSIDAVEALLRFAWPHAFRIAFSIVRDRNVAEDAAQEACAAAFSSIRSLRSSAAFSVWFYRIVVREAFAQERRRKPGPSLSDVPESATPFTSAIVRLDVLRALEKLPPRQRAAVGLYYYAQLSSVEIAEIFGIADSSVRFHLMQARRRLERSLADHRDIGCEMRTRHNAH